MKHIYFLLLFLCFFYYGICQNSVELQSSEQKSEIIKNDEKGFLFTNSIDKIYLDESETGNGKFFKITIPGYYPDNKIGYPELPVLIKLIEIPDNAEVEINIISYDEQIIELKEYNIEYPLYPNQPSLRKDEDTKEIKFKIDNNIYKNKEFYSTELIRIENIGKMRGIQIAQLVISPFSYDAGSNVLTVKNNLEVEIIFNNADLVQTKKIKNCKYSTSFERSYEELWNYNVSQNKDVSYAPPIKYVIISHRMFEETLSPFIEWKIKKGFEVITAYTDEIGEDPLLIKNYLKGLYNNATETDPAPTYLLIVGDIEYVPSNQCGTHVTDMYYCEFDEGEDYIPDMYFGRFSVTNTRELKSLIEKTLMYEQYSFQKSEFLSNAMFVVGKDNAQSSIIGNGQVNYVTKYYFNEEHSLNVNKYLHPISANSISAIKANINNGIGYVSYTAHCDENGWNYPDLTVSDVKRFTNEEQYFFSIGNCCMSNKFDEPECFGEALTRAEKKGGVAHLGSSGYTYWKEDYYWSVGLINNPILYPTYEGTGPGVYDHLFHENGEKPYITAGQMNYIGNMSVTSSPSDLKRHYWEVYHLMGDPSLTPYVGIPSLLEAEYQTIINVGTSEIEIKTEPDAYVALSNNGTLLAASFTNSEGIINLKFESLTLPEILDIVITKQFRQPHIAQIEIVNGSNENDAAISHILEPNTLIHVNNAIFKPSVRIMNIGKQNLRSATIGYKINDEDSEEINWVGDLQYMETEILEFNETSLKDGIHELKMYIKAPNGYEDENPLNNVLLREINVYSGKVSISDIISPEPITCNDSGFIPEIIVNNNDNHPLNSLECSYVCGDKEHNFVWEGNIEGMRSQNIKFPKQDLSSGTNKIKYSISRPNAGTNINYNSISLNKDFYLITSGQTIRIELQTDPYPEETSWDIIDKNNFSLLYSENSYKGIQKKYIHEYCLGGGCYTFTIYDSANDGLSGSDDSNKGYIKITNITTGEVILDLDGINFYRDHSVDFCIDAVQCPSNKNVSIKDNKILLDGGYPQNGIYIGSGVENNCFYPFLVGIGIHPVKYIYTTESNKKLECEFNIIVSDYDNAYCPADIQVNHYNEKFPLTGAIPDGGEYTGKGVENNYFDPSVAGIGTHVVKYVYNNEDTNKIECEFNIRVSDHDDVYCPEDMQINYYDEKFPLMGAIPDGGEYTGKGVENNYFDPSIAGIGNHLIRYDYVNNLGKKLNCEFKIIVEEFNSNFPNTHNSNTIKVYPNPVNDILFIRISENTNIYIELINILGETINKDYIIDGNEIEIDMSSYPDGAYFIKVMCMKDIITKKLIIKKQ